MNKKMTLNSGNIQLLARRLPEPENYFKGIMAAPVICAPTSILCFFRTTLSAEHHLHNDCHQRYVLILNLKGENMVFINEHPVVLPENHALFITPGQLHHYAYPQKQRKWLFITFELSRVALNFFPSTTIPLNPKLIHTAEELIESYLEANTCEYTYITLLSALLIARLNASIQPHQPLPRVMSRDEELVSHINQYVHNHISEAITLNLLCHNCGISAVHLRRCFQKVMGVPLGKYIQTIRINHASRLLQTTTKNISEISFDCGFSSLPVFCRAFKRATGTSPRDFRTKTRP